MSGKATGWAFEVRVEHDLSPSAGYVLAAYADNADADGKCWPDKSTIVKKTGYGKSTVYRSIETLETEGLLRFDEDEKGRECVYLALSDVSHPGKEESQGGKTASDALSQPGNEESQPGKNDSHSGKATNKGTVNEPSGTKNSNVDVPDFVAELYGDWKTLTGRNGGTRLTPGRRTAVKARLDDGYSVEEIRRAIANCASSPFHQGKNDREQRFDDLTLICRNGEKLEQFRDMGDGGAAPPKSVGSIEGESEARRAWDKARETLRDQLPESTFELWITGFEAAGSRGGRIVLVDTRAAGGGNRVAWTERRYMSLVLKALELADAEYSGVEFVDETQLELEAA